MSAGQYLNSIKNLVEVYIPEEFEAKDSQVEIPSGRTWHLVFEDPSGVLDIWAFTVHTRTYSFNIMDEDFHQFLLDLAPHGLGYKKRFRDAFFKMNWHSSGP